MCYSIKQGPALGKENENIDAIWRILAVFGVYNITLKLVILLLLIPIF